MAFGAAAATSSIVLVERVERVKIVPSASEAGEKVN